MTDYSSTQSRATRKRKLKIGEKVLVAVYYDYYRQLHLNPPEQVEVIVNKVEHLAGNYWRYTADEPVIVQWVEEVVA